MKTMRLILGLALVLFLVGCSMPLFDYLDHDFFFGDGTPNYPSDWEPYKVTKVNSLTGERCFYKTQIVGEPTEPCLVWLFIEWMEETHPGPCGPG